MAIGYHQGKTIDAEGFIQLFASCGDTRVEASGNRRDMPVSG